EPAGELAVDAAHPRARGIPAGIRGCAGRSRREAADALARHRAHACVSARSHLFVATATRIALARCGWRPGKGGLRTGVAPPAQAAGSWRPDRAAGRQAAPGTRTSLGGSRRLGSAPRSRTEARD